MNPLYTPSLDKIFLFITLAMPKSKAGFVERERVTLGASKHRTAEE